MFSSWLQVSHSLPCRDRILNLGSCTGPDIPADIDHKDLICHVDLPLMHVIEHLLGTLSPDLIIAGMTEETDADDNIAFSVSCFCAS